MSKLNIVLIEPEIPQNTGNIARTCAATGARLHLVGPMGFKIDDKKLKRAGLDYWHLLDITYYENIEDFFKKKTQGDFLLFLQQRHARYTVTQSIPITAIYFSARKQRDCLKSCCLSTLTPVSDCL